MLLNCGIGEDSSETLYCKEIQPVHPKGSQSWIFIGRTDAVTEVPILWPPDVKSWLIRNDPDAGKDRRKEEKGTTEDEMVGWHHWWDGHEFEQAPGVGDGQGSLACVHGVAKSGTRLSDWTEQYIFMYIDTTLEDSILAVIFFPLSPSPILSLEELTLLPRS